MRTPIFGGLECHSDTLTAEVQDDLGSVENQIKLTQD